MRTSLYLG